VIKNERQHRITRAHAEKFRATLNELAATPRPKNVHPKLWEAQKAGLKSQLQDLEAELQEYEALKTGGPRILELDSLDGLPKVLIQARIAAGCDAGGSSSAFGCEAPTNPALRSQRLSDCKLRAASRDCTLARSRCMRDSRDGPKVIVQTAIRSEIGRRALPRLPQ
jgi:hypothetical protein